MDRPFEFTRPMWMAGLKKYAEDFVSWLKTNDGKSNIEDHREHEQYFKQMLSPQKLVKLTEDEVAQVYKKLWASQIWVNKDWYIKHKLLEPNGLENIAVQLNKLLYGDDDIAQRYDHFRNNIQGFGASSISEILHMVFPDKYPLWNDKPKTVIPFLKLDILPEKFFKYQITQGKEYAQIVEKLGAVKDSLKEYGVKDFIDLDLFFWYLFQDVVPEEKPAGPRKKREAGEAVQATPKFLISSHEGAEYYLLELGRMLGYFPYTVDQSKTFNGRRLGDTALLKQLPPIASERDMKTIKEIDVIWVNEEENPAYAFEVEHTTDIVHGLDRLIQLQHQRVKLVVVSSEDQRAKYERLLERIQYRKLKDMFHFISYEELARFYEATAPFYEMRTKLLGAD